MRSERGNNALIITDNRLPILPGIALLEPVRQTAPDTLRFMLAGQAAVVAALRTVYPAIAKQAVA